jgi:hypothetical protein
MGFRISLHYNYLTKTYQTKIIFKDTLFIKMISVLNVKLPLFFRVAFINQLISHLYLK